MENFVYEIPTKVYFGKNQIEHLGEELSKYGKNVLLTYGGGSIKKIGIYDKILEQINKYNLSLFELSGIEPNPRIESVRQGSKMCKENNINVVLAVGGGSTIDCSKIICANALDNCDPWDYFAEKNQIKDALPLVTILTLAATGSEMDCGAVITNIETNDKLAAGGPMCRPKASFLDPTYTYTVSKYQTACGSADILCHVFEEYFNTYDDFYMLDTFMEGLMKTIIKYAPIAFNEPDNYEARANLMWASSWAINGFIKAGKTHTWSIHTIEHQLSAYYDITHGLGNAILMPRWMKYSLNEKTLYRYVQFGKNVFNINSNLNDIEIANKSIEMIEDFLFNKLSLQSNLSSLNINEDNFEIMAYKAVNEKRNPKKGVIQGFIDYYQDDVVKILKMCL